MCRYPETESLEPLERETDEALRSLQERLDNANLDSDEQRAVLNEELQSLRAVLQAAQYREKWADNVLAWPIQSSPAFVNLLRTSEPHALIMLAYWAAWFNILDNLWWARGWSNILITEVTQDLGSEWRPLLQWPRTRIGLPT